MIQFSLVRVQVSCLSSFALCFRKCHRFIYRGCGRRKTRRGKYTFHPRGTQNAIVRKFFHLEAVASESIAGRVWRPMSFFGRELKSRWKRCFDWYGVRFTSI